MDVDYRNLENDIETGVFRIRLEEELIAGFRQIHAAGERLPPASYYASKIAEIVNRGSDEKLSAELAYYVYQEILAAVEAARASVLGEEQN